MADLLYLDLNRWINFARARLGRPASESYAEALTELRAAVTTGRVVVPLSFAHYIELSTIKNPTQRADVALTMDEISRRVVLTPREVLLAHELRWSMAREFDVTYSVHAPPVTGHGLAHAFDEADLIGPRFRGDPEKIRRFVQENRTDLIGRLEQLTGHGWKFMPSGKVTDAVDLVHEAIDAAMQFSVLRGPDDAKLSELISKGYNPSLAYEVIDRMLRREADLARRLAAEPVWKRRLDDILAARAMYWDVSEEWPSAMADLGLPTMELETIGSDTLTRILNGVPIIDVESAIRRGHFRNGSYTWTTNDVYDISFVGQAIVYCDAVFTDNNVRMQATRQGIDRKYGTVIFRRVEELTAWLRSDHQELSEAHEAHPSTVAQPTVPRASK